jgi:hypothetical protein
MLPYRGQIVQVNLYFVHLSVCQLLHQVLVLVLWLRLAPLATVLCLCIVQKVILVAVAVNVDVAQRIRYLLLRRCLELGQEVLKSSCQ